MIPNRYIIEWQNTVPLQSPALVEQDLVLSKALIELYQNPVIAKTLVFRGGTALHKLFIPGSTRYSEDLDFVQIKAKPIGEIADALRGALDPWLGKPKYKRGKGRVTFIYRFETTQQPVEKMRLKIEINTREHFNVLSLIKKEFSVSSSWFTGKADVVVYQLEELLGTKLRALYQRKKSRDLFDLHMAYQELAFKTDQVIECFQKYAQFEDASISRAEFEENLYLKLKDSAFKQDMETILASDLDWNFQEAFDYVLNNIIPLLPGEPWKSAQK